MKLLICCFMKCVFRNGRFRETGKQAKQLWLFVKKKNVVRKTFSKTFCKIRFVRNSTRAWTVNTNTYWTVHGKTWTWTFPCPQLCSYQSWARAFCHASRLRAFGRSSSRWRCRALIFSLNYAHLRSRFRATGLLDFSRSFFALLNFSLSFSGAPQFFALLNFSHSYICAPYFHAHNFVLVRQDRTARTGHPEQDS